jgi:predicted metalloprotease with PDZ domain
MRKRYPALLAPLVWLWLAASAAPALAGQALEPIVYTVKFPEPAKHYALVEAVVPTGKQAAVELMMPVWTPGFYRVENYAGRVENLSARTPDGKALQVEQPRKNRWRVQAGGAPAVIVSYRLNCTGRSVTSNWVGEDMLVINGGPSFLTLAEKARRPHEVRLELPPCWKQSMTGLDPAPDGKPNCYRAADFDTLVDSPIVAGNLAVRTFDVEGSKHLLVNAGDFAKWDSDRVARDVEQIVRAHQRMWGFLPFKRYVFLFVFRPGGGGLEHANSTLVTTSPTGMQNPRGYQSWLGLVCHEYFHAFNAKRLRPVELGPFDYEKEPRTSGLWVAEGLTVYYDGLLLARAGLSSREEALARLSSRIRQLQTTPGRLVQSLEQASLDVWTSSFSGMGGGPKTVSYYVKGPIVGFLLDARIRRATGGAKSMDDLMKLAYARYAGERGFTEKQFREAASEVAGTDLGEWFNTAVSSTKELDYEEALDWFGLRFVSVGGGTPPNPRPAEGKKSDSGWRLEVRPDATAAQQARLTAWLGQAASASRPPEPVAPKVTAPPESFFAKVRERDREVARKFYKKYVDVQGMAVVASGDVADEALQRTHYLVTRLLAGRPDILQAMVKNGTRLIIIGKDQVYTDMPEYRNHWNPEYQNERVRGTGGFDVTSFGEENLLNLPLDRYDDESIAVHEFCHTIDAALSRIDPTWRKRLAQTYKNALANGLWKNAYTASNPAEYWAEICQSYFDCNRVNNWNHNSIGTREQLKLYDPAGYDLVKATFRLKPEQDWRYTPLRRQPSVIAPPAKFKPGVWGRNAPNAIDPYYTKFTYAREFVVLGSKHVSDEALLRANDVIRKMFAYRHDVLKAMIADGARLVVLGRKEKLSDLPEFKGAKDQAGFDEVRFLDYDKRLKLLVVPEENVLGLPGEPFAGKCMVVRAFAGGLYDVTASRPVDPDFDRRRGKQQYELRVKRLDVRFDEALQKLHDAARGKGLWKGTAAAGSRREYWVAGVEAYFDAVGDAAPPALADRPITTREALKTYDPELFALVEDTMAYKEHVDWRRRARPR